jgi:hypothetical protein
VSDPRDETDEASKARRRRNLTIGLALAAFAILTFVVTIVRLGGHVADRTF